ncbi:MAG: CDP-alcohol phosphatidyltransferase family protein [Desulfatiglandaceae bacterium]
MERVVSIIVSLFIALLIYLAFEIALKREKTREYFRRHVWLHPNAICVWRVLIGLSGMLLYFTAKEYFWGILLFTVSAVLDGVDGLVARECQLITASGEEIDPLCDKLTYLPPMAFFAYQGLLSVSAIWTLVFIEFCGQFVVRYILKHFTNFSVQANNFGKIKAVLCFSLIIYCAVLDGDLQIRNFTAQMLHLCIVLSIASSVFKAISNRFYADILSILNLSCGLVGILLVSQGNYVLAALAVLAGQVFDLFDGRMAEKHGGTKFGPWLDDIADLVSFGFCPALLIYFRGELKLPSLFFAVLYCFAIGFRLWRYLMRDKHDETLPPGVFNGLPSPAGAIAALGACLYWENLWAPGAVVLFTAYLLLSHIRFVHFGRVILRHTPRTLLVIFGFFVVLIIAYLIKVRNPEILGAFLLISFLFYVLTGNSRFAGKIIYLGIEPRR